MTHETYINLEYASDNYRCLEGVGDWERRLNSDHPDAFKFKGGKLDVAVLTIDFAKYSVSFDPNEADILLYFDVKNPNTGITEDEIADACEYSGAIVTFSI